MVIKNGKTIYEPLTDFFVPGNKTGLLNYLTTHYPKDAQKFFGMKRNRLMAIYMKTRSKNG
jgi:hypothetical protein